MQFSVRSVKNVLWEKGDGPLPLLEGVVRFGWVSNSKWIFHL